VRICLRVCFRICPVCVHNIHYVENNVFLTFGHLNATASATATATATAIAIATATRFTSCKMWFHLLTMFDHVFDDV
jgi:hypothetical protein